MTQVDAHGNELPADDAGWRERLTPEQFQVTRQAGTERAFTGAYWDTKDEGTYRCICCDEVLFTSDTKFDSGSGWPSFWEPAESDKVTLHVDSAHGMVRTEVSCARCGAHLGHVFEDGPQPTGQRFCMNSCALRLDPPD
ncbi:MAG TPA: peptide-methionine (R)-S-oxide reductase MsrB [Acidimicrobiales bacterium]|nr:peptide-methionine (R)-S-oxide reductase MsrB [Acidimicrobiales bacterium]